MPRPTCPRCTRPLNQCFCQSLREETACMDLVILQHPTETRHPLNTARILELGIKNCSIFIGENFEDNAELQAALKGRKTYLLFPGDDAITSEEALEQGKPEVLIVLDGTWRKARKIYFTNLWLQALPCIALKDLPASNYRIRKAPGKESLSTLEATVALLREAGNDSQAHEPLLNAFDQMINQQISAMGQSTYQKNYSKSDPTKGSRI
ncbi:tRNA-uridine aminocarboxypropyltransferase [uncultured Endozoicomonas sp.]|uniref:tRNA-uridine aminocarboxypropyltransferase n=1 Tax=uncultured Endozoicomonas sp. TaxID=432652 RepID=UPI0026039511|nr:tRNA-uridine aminocarboxypropyltransferase [uncultured Endozoicomonas sp.]